MSDDKLQPPDRSEGGAASAAPSQASAEAGRSPGASRSLLWSVGGQFATTLATLAATVVLARILTPTDFGAFAFAATIYAVVQWLLQVGMGNYILREAELSQAKIDGAVAVTCVQGLLGTLIVLAVAPVAGWFSHYPTVGWVTASVAIVPLLGAPEAISDALWLRDGRYARVAVLQVAKAGLQSLVAITAQLVFHWSVYALVAGLLAAIVTSFTAAAWSLARDYRARPVLDREIGAVLRNFGGRTFVLTLAQILSLRVPDLLIGRFIGVNILGHYSRATNANEMFARTASAAVIRATAPRFYRAVHGGEPMGRAVARYCDTLLFFVWPGLAGLAALAGPVIHLIYGPQWHWAAVALPFLCLVSAIDAARTGGMEVLLVRDRIGLNARLELLHGAYAILLVVALARFGLVAVLWGRIAESIATTILYLVAMRRLGAHAPGSWRGVFGRNALLAAAAGGPALLLMWGWHWPERLTAIQFALAIGGGLAAWSLSLAVTRHPFLMVGVAMVRRRLARSA